MSGDASGGAGPGGTGPGAVQKQIEGWGRTLLTALVLGVPTAVINGLNAGINRSLTAEPWRALFFIGPLAALAWWCWKVDRRGASLRLRRPLALFLLCYLCVFTLAATSDVLVWKRQLVGFDAAELPASWKIAPVSIRNWRYRLARRPTAERDLFVVTLDSTGAATRAAGRVQLAHFIAAAAKTGARAVALDFWFDSIASPADPLVCRAAAEAEAAGMAVIWGVALEPKYGRLAPRPGPPILRDCLESAERGDLERDHLQRGHLLGYREPDGQVRAVPLRPGGADALGLKVAAVLAADLGRELDVPAADLFHFLEPAEPLPVVQDSGLADAAELFPGKVLLVGEASERERFETPYGPRLGVEIHAAVAQSLLARRWMRRPPWWTSVLVIVVGCFVITHAAANAAPARRLVHIASTITVVMGLAAFGLAYLGIWVDVVYVVAAVWPLVGLLVLRGRWAARRPAAEPRPLQPAGGAE